jgi:16S rRNA (cytidine1402-2'-O)-methyltransferase
MKKGSLYLIPNSIGSQALDVTTPVTLEVVQHINHFIVEEIKSARRFLRAIGYTKDFEEVEFIILNEHSKSDNLLEFLQPTLLGHDMGIISEAGVPCVADPGSVVVRQAHELGIRVVPLVGASSILLTIMASGLNGQSFSFNGYLPRERTERVKKIKQLEINAVKFGQTQLFMDAPYRNDQVLEDLLIHLSPKTMICIATDVTTQGERINTKSAEEWKSNVPKLHKRPVMFAIGA